MRVKININYIIFLFILLVYYKLFYLVELPGTLGATTNMVPVLLLANIFFLIYILNNKFRLKVSNFIFGKYVLYLFITSVILFIYSIIKYVDEPISTLIIQGFLFTEFLVYFPLCELMRRHFHKIVKILLWTATITAFIFILISVFYNFFNIKIFNLYSFSYGDIKIFERENGIRLLTVCLVDFSPFIAIAYLYSVKTRASLRGLCILNGIVVAIYEWYVSQTRSILLMILFVLFFYFMLKRQKNIIFKIIKPVIIVLGIIFIACIMMQMNEIIDYLLTDYSFKHRMDAIRYYFIRLYKSPIFGNGLLPDEPATVAYNQIVHGYGRSKFGYSDVGIFGVLGHYGMIGGSYYFLVIVIMIKLLKQYKNSYTFILPFLLSIIMSMLNLSMFDTERILVLIIEMALIDAYIFNQYLLNPI